MYEAYYGLTAKPFQLNPDPSFFFGSKGHTRAMSYLDYGIHQGEGFIVITGEVGAGKTTLVKNLFNKIEGQNIVAGQIVTTQLDADDMLRMVALAFGLAAEDVSKATLLKRIESFLVGEFKQGRRVLLVVDEAQNLTSRAVEELRMLSNVQVGERSPLQSFLLGQPEFRRTMQSEGMQQLRQRVIASYHLGPMDSDETRRYIEHRLQTAGWKNDPTFSEGAFGLIHGHTGGIPRRINLLCDRLMLMGFLDEVHHIGEPDVQQVIDELQGELAPDNAAMIAGRPASDPKQILSVIENQIEVETQLSRFEQRLAHVERSVVGVLKLMRDVVTSALPRQAPATLGAESTEQPRD